MNLVDALVLKGLRGVGDGTVTKLLEFSKNNSISRLDELARISVQNLPLKTVPVTLRELLSKGEFAVERSAIEDDLETWAEQEVTVIHIGSAQYPNHLLEVENPPPFLFCKGDVSLLQHTLAIAVVGTRKNTSKGAKITTKTVEAFKERGFVIVSGLALGIDSIAHRAALDFGAPTIAVLVDLSKISPSTNRGLAEEILQQGGLLVAENPPGTPTIAAFFAKRDRIQAGLSTAVFAIETSKDGGTMHAVKAAEKMKRPVFVPDVVAAKYQDLGLKAIEGTQYLAEKSKARMYTGESYESITNELIDISNRFTLLPVAGKQIGLPL